MLDHVARRGLREETQIRTAGNRMCRVRPNFVADHMQVDLARPEEKRLATVAEGDRLHPQHAFVEVDGALRISDRQHEVVETGYPYIVHVTSYSCDVSGRATLPGDLPAEESAFNFRSGRLCLAFVATIGERWRRNHERLRSPADLARWYRDAGVLEETVVITARGLEIAHGLREAIYGEANRMIRNQRSSRDDEAVINAAAAYPPLIPVLRARRVGLVLPAEAAERSALSTVARDAIDMLTTVDPTRLRECSDPECGLLFVDTSRPGRRRWCSSDACGGRNRAAAYRRRNRAGQGNTR
jgi:predicted RNA-binding Zn ribbon-like protein